jgi:hypothetical protein
MLRDRIDPNRAVSLLDGRNGMDVLFDSFGGAISRVAPDATAFPHRKSLASAQIYAGATPSTRDRVARSVAEVRDGLGTMTGKSGYVNYIDPTMPDWQIAYYGGNLTRLREVARRYDPDAVFGFGQSLTKD